MIDPSPPPPATVGDALHLSSRGRWLWLQFGPLLLSAVLLAVAWGVTLHRLAEERRMAIDQSGASQRNLAHIIADNLRNVVDRGSQYAFAAAAIPTAPATAAAGRLSSLLFGDRVFNRAALFDRNGRPLAASGTDVPSAELNGQIAQVTAELREGAAPQATVGPVSAAADESWQVPLLLPVLGTTADCCAILVLHLDLGYLLRLYQDIDIGRTGTIQVFRDDGFELARAKRGGLEISSGSGPHRSVPLGIALDGSTIVPAEGAAGLRLVSLGDAPGYPFVVAVGQDLDEVLDDYRSRRLKYLVTLSLLTVVVLALTAVTLALNERLRRYVDAVVRSEREKAELVDQLQEEKQHAYELASRDHLTSLANRRMFMTLAASHIARARRSRKFYAVMFLDLDRFKAINDSLGHRIGDLLLQTVAQRLRDGLRQSDVIARLGGDEFVVLITGVEKESDVGAIAAKLIASIGAPCPDLDGHEVQASPSIGVALYPRDGDNLDTLMRHADLAMYESKRAGRGRCTFFDPAMNSSAGGSFDLEQRVPRAIEAGEFVLHYQPKFDLQGGRVCGFEALIRWQHPNYGMVYPNEFIPMCESTGHITALGNWIIREACRQIAQWRAEGLAPLPVAINLSGRQFRDESLPERVVAALRDYGVEPALLQVEVTESSLVESVEDASRLLDVLVAAGIKVALDDFGSGFSSLGYIKTLPIDVIKIDRSFVRDILNSHDDRVIVLSTIALAHNLGMRVVAEGVETRGQVAHLKTGGCDEVQGYYVSRPMPAAEASEWIRRPVRSLA